MKKKMVINKSKTTEIRLQAEACMKNGNYTEAFFHWTHAIKIDPQDSKLYFERSKCFMQQEQFYFALQDAEMLIQLNPQSSQGYSRKAEVLFETKHFSEALPIIQKCFTLSSEKDYYMDWSKRCKREISKQKSVDNQYPFVGAAVGIVISVLGIVWDYLIRGNNSQIANPILKVLIVVSVSAASYWIAKMYRKYTDTFKSAMLQPPIDLFGLDNEQEEQHQDHLHKD